MADIVDRLRDKRCCDDACHCDEAADEIERLRAALERAADFFFDVGMTEEWAEARAALTAQPAEGEKHE